ncbi:MAG: hypothetical protein FH761_19285 [Firmicutes bacterium]|nr:hypothetical protein [Bacillota bacterium]
MRRKMVKNHYFCVGCQKKIIEDDMVMWDCSTGKGFCRTCSDEYTFTEREQLLKYGHVLYNGEQLRMENIPSPLPY